MNELLELPSAELDLSSQFVIAFLYAECLAKAPKQLAQRSQEIARQLSGCWPDPDASGLRVSPFGNNFELRRRLALLLAALGDSTLVDRVAKSLLPGPSQEDRLLGLLALRNARHGWTNDTRREYFTALRDAQQFVGGEGMPGFLERLRNDSLAMLADGERALVEDLFTAEAADDEPLPPPRPKVTAWTLKDLKPLTDRDATPGDAKRGAAIFREALCSRCHRAGATGPAVGPDLTYVARRFDRGDILESIVEPSRSVAENYRNLIIATDSGQVLVGRLATTGDFRAEKLRLNVDPLSPGQFIEIDKSEVEEQRLGDTSPMPQGLLDGFTCEEIADLMAFLEDGIRASQ